MLPIDPVALAKELVEIPSPTGEEAAMTRRTAELCRHLELDVRLQEVEPHRHNIFATAGKPRVVLCSHLDTVPPYVSVSEDEFFLYGRGACDAKGIIAAMLAAAGQLLVHGQSDFALLFLVGEETDSIGAKRANEELGGETQAIAVGEPTQNRLAIAQKGVLTAKIRCLGRAAHGAYPEAGQSAIPPMLRILQELDSTDWGGSPKLGKNTLNIGTLRAGLAVNVIPPTAEASIQIRVATEIDRVEEQLRAIIGKRAHVEILKRTPPLHLGRLPDLPTTVVAFGTDLPYLINFGDRYLIGPGSILDAHTAEEKIRKSDILAATQIFFRLVQTLSPHPVASRD